MCRDAFYGGAAGGGKSNALLMAALQFVDVPGYNALLIRDTYQNLSMPGALMDRAHQWLAPYTKSGLVKWHADARMFTFPCGATLKFGYLDGPLDHFNYQSAEFQFVGIDEAVAIREHQALYLFSRLRRLAKSNTPIRFRCASNPPRPEQVAKGAWVKERYISNPHRVDPQTNERRVFIPARLEDNPYLDQVDYDKSLNYLDPITRRQLRQGDWEIQAAGRIFKRENFPIIDAIPAEVRRWCRFWDLAATEVRTESHDPDYAVGLLMGMTGSSHLVIPDVVRMREGPSAVETIVLQTAHSDEGFIGHRGFKMRMEQEGGASGKTVIANYAKLFVGWDFKGCIPTKNKLQRATPLANQVERKNVLLVRGPWNRDFLNEYSLFPDGLHDDQVDAGSGALAELTQRVIPSAMRI
jgi:predicted phage terminase large subunit-like protein